jgi:serine O-acetyltransferase
MFDAIRTAYAKDPALRGVRGYLAAAMYPGVVAINGYRAAHALRKAHVPFFPFIIFLFARWLTGIEINPGAKIGKRFFIDHGSGTVIGETAEIGNDVMMYHGVTLGGHGWWHDSKGEKRHPTIRDDVVIGVGSTILGPVTIGKGARIGAMVLVIDDIPEKAVVVGSKGKIVVRNGSLKQLKDPDKLDVAEAEYFI